MQIPCQPPASAAARTVRGTRKMRVLIPEKPARLCSDRIELQQVDGTLLAVGAISFALGIGDSPMAGNTRNEPGQERDDLKAAALDRGKAALDRGKEQLESAKGRWAEGAERVAEAVDRTADELEGDGGAGPISGFGHSVASLMRQLSGGLRERDVDEFARELGTLARRNPGMFLAGSVALGFGVARFFKARTPSSGYVADDRAQPDGEWREMPGEASGVRQAFGIDSGRQQDFGTQQDFDGEENLDLSAASEQRAEGNGIQDDITKGGNS
jgi:hypothetical protein